MDFLNINVSINVYFYTVQNRNLNDVTLITTTLHWGKLYRKRNPTGHKYNAFFMAKFALKILQISEHNYQLMVTIFLCLKALLKDMNKTFTFQKVKLLVQLSTAMKC